MERVTGRTALTVRLDTLYDFDRSFSSIMNCLSLPAGCLFQTFHHGVEIQSVPEFRDLRFGLKCGNTPSHGRLKLLCRADIESLLGIDPFAGLEIFDLRIGCPGRVCFQVGKKIADVAEVLGLLWLNEPGRELSAQIRTHAALGARYHLGGSRKGEEEYESQHRENHFSGMISCIISV